MTDDQIKALVREEFDRAIRACKLEVVTTHYGNGLVPLTYVRHKLPSVYRGYGGICESAQETDTPTLLTQILRALDELGMELYTKPAQLAEWGLRKKACPESENSSETVTGDLK